MALLITLVSLVFRLVYVALFFPGVSKRPVPRETTHSTGVSGHRHLHSWIARAVGLLISRPPSCTQTGRGHFTCRFLQKHHMNVQIQKLQYIAGKPQFPPRLALKYTKKPHRSAFNLYPYCTQSSGGATGASVGIVE